MKNPSPIRGTLAGSYRESRNYGVTLTADRHAAGPQGGAAVTALEGGPAVSELQLAGAGQRCRGFGPRCLPSAPRPYAAQVHVQ